MSAVSFTGTLGGEYVNIDQLRIFLAVAEHRSFTRAAETMYISHSTTSRNVASLEADLGVRLLTRDNRSVKLTPAGELLCREGARILKKIESVENAVKNAGQGLAGSLTVASVNLYSHALYSGYRDFCSRYPDVVLGMYHRDVQSVWDQVHTGEADIGITFSFALPHDLGLFNIESIASERFCVVAPVEHPLALRKTVKLHEIQNTGYISLPTVDVLTRSEGRQFFSSDQEISIVPTLESLFLQIRSGNGVSMVPYPIAYEYGSNCAILDIEGIDTSFDIVMVWRRDNINPSLPLFMEILSNHIK